MTVVAEEVAKAQFETLLERASQGEVIVITREGRPVVEIKPAQQGSSSGMSDQVETDSEREARLDKATAVIDGLSRKYASRGITLDEIREWINEGRP